MQKQLTKCNVKHVDPKDIDPVSAKIQRIVDNINVDTITPGDIDAICSANGLDKKGREMLEGMILTKQIAQALDNEKSNRQTL